jgi:SulP family sulfate permease
MFIAKQLKMMSSRYREFLPKTISCFQEGYSFKTFFSDLFAGVSVGIIALPLAMAFAIASGVAPERGLFTAIVAGFIISLLGGSRTQIAGPTGAFVVIIYAVVQRHGYDGLAVATLMAGIMIFLMGIARLGSLIKFIPYPVIIGFTAGIALSIFSSAVKDFLGLQTAGAVPVEFLDKWTLYYQTAHTWSPWAVAIGTVTLGAIFLLRWKYPRLPGVILTLVVVTAIAWVFGVPTETIGSKFGEIPNMLPAPSLPELTLDKIQAVFPDAITIALLGAIESLLSAVIADGMTGTRHRSNGELVAQGLGNLGSVIFGGIPATGAIARTAANIKLGAKTPVAGMIHSVTLLVLMILVAPCAALIPLPALAAVLFFIAWNMSELENCMEVAKGPFSETLVMLITFLLTVLIDLTVAVQVGVILAAVIFMKRMTDLTKGNITKYLEQEVGESEEKDSEFLYRSDVPREVTVFEIDGPLFYGAADILNEAYQRLDSTTKIFILRLHKCPLIDATGLQALKKFNQRCEQHGIKLLISGTKPEITKQMLKSHEAHGIPLKNFFPTISTALEYSKTLLESQAN